MARNISELVDNSAEGGVIASLIYHPEYLLSDNNLRPRFFYNQENQLMFWAISQLVENGVTQIDPLNLKNIICSDPRSQRIANEFGITNLQQYISLAQVAARDTFEEYKLLKDTIINLAFRRELLKFSGSIGNECFNKELTLDQINEFVNDGIAGIAEKFIFGEDSVQFGEKVDAIWERICNNRNDDGTFGIPSLLPTLNQYMTFGKGELTLVAGPTGRGKSSYFLAETCNCLKHGIPCVIIDTELTDDVWFPRYLACMSGVMVKKIKNGMYTKEEEQRILKVKEWTKKAKLVHEFNPMFNKMYIEQVCRKWDNKNELGLFVYDYIKPSEIYGAADISQNLGLITDFIKLLAGKMNIPAIAGLQLNELTGRVADSMKPERYCDALLFWRPKTIEMLTRDGIACGNFYMQIKKNRNDALLEDNDYIDINFTGDIMSISEAEKHQIKDTPC